MRWRAWPRGVALSAIPVSFLALGWACLELTRLPVPVLPLLAFELAFAALLASALWPPRSYTYGFLALFLGLGFWVKFHAHAMARPALNEPYGAFLDTAEAWREVLLVAAAGVVGVVAGRWSVVASRALLARAGRQRRARSGLAYESIRRPLWGLSVAGGLVLAALNAEMAFYQIGIEPRYALPFPFGAGLGILLFAGIALGFGWLIETELRRDPRSFRWCVPLALLVVAATATSTLSRFFFMLHAGAYGIAAVLWVRRRRAPWLLWAPSLFLAGLLTLGSVYGVSWLRGKAYPIARTGQILPELTPGFRWRELLEEDPQPLRAQAAVQLRPSRPDARPARPARPPIERSPEEVERAGAVRYLREIPALFVRRWIGLEGLMAVSSHPHLGPALLREALFERPPPDGLGVYQEIARASSYRRVGRFAPMTLPGFLGVAYYSGSMLVVLLSCWAMAFALTAADLGLERMGVRPWARAAGGATVGYLVVQANMMTSTVRAIAGVLAVLFLIGLLERWLEIEPREPHRSGPG